MKSLNATRNYQIFAHQERFIQGWYWALPSKQLKPGQVKPVKLLGRNLAVYRGENRQVVALDAYCPHMGAHLAEGKVEGNCLRCFFHNWKFDDGGNCIEIPALNKPLPVSVKSWAVEEKYGLIWVWVGESAPQSLPLVPELETEEVDSILGSRFVKNCHPNVVLVNAIDAHHFNTVHNLPFDIIFKNQEVNENAIIFSNTTRGGDESLLIWLMRPFYKNEITYTMCYWYGSTGVVTLGPDFLHFHIMFALRLIEGGKTEGQTILITKKRLGWLGRLLNPLLLWLTQQVGNYFAKGDTQVFQTIEFDLKTPTVADRSILQFIDHTEKQKFLSWGTWQ